MMTVLLIDDSDDREWNDIVNVTGADEMCHYQYFDHNVIKTVTVQQLAK